MGGTGVGFKAAADALNAQGFSQLPVLSERNSASVKYCEGLPVPPAAEPAADAAPCAAVDIAAPPALAAPPTTAVAAEESMAALTTMATAHIRRPCAVSRKNTSSVWMPVQPVRSRPVT